LDNKDRLFLEILHFNLAMENATFASINNSLSLFESDKTIFIGAFGRASSRIRLGSDINAAFNMELAEFSHLACRGLELKEVIESVYKEIEWAYRMRLETGFGALQKYATLATVITTVVPSLVLFGFIGYSIMYGPAFLPLLGIILLAVLPVSLYIVERKIRGIYE